MSSFEIISKLSHFEKNYTIYISQKNIDEYNLINEYSDIAFLETKLNIKMMDFKIKKFKSFLNNYNRYNIEQKYKTSRNIKKKNASFKKRQ